MPREAGADIARPAVVTTAIVTGTALVSLVAWGALLMGNAVPVIVTTEFAPVFPRALLAVAHGIAAADIVLLASAAQICRAFRF